MRSRSGSRGIGIADVSGADVPQETEFQTMPIANVREGKTAVFAGFEVTVEAIENDEVRLRFEVQEHVRIIRLPEKKPVDTLKNAD